MSITAEHSTIKVPSTYQDWLLCFDVMKNGSGADNDVFAAAKGWVEASGYEVRFKTLGPLVTSCADWLVKM